MHVCIDDASCIAFRQVMKNAKNGSAVAFRKAAVCDRRARHGQWLLLQFFAFRNACRGLNYIRAKPYTPKNTGEAERLILREWAYAYAYNISKERDTELATVAAPLQLASGGSSRFVNQSALLAAPEAIDAINLFSVDAAS